MHGNLPIQFPASTNLLNDLAEAMKALDGKKKNYPAMLDSAPLCSKPAPPKLDVHSTTLLTGDAGGYHCECSCFDRAEQCR